MLTIDPKIQGWIPPLRADELSLLEASIVESQGARDPLVVWNGTLVDGHNRYAICTRLELPFTTVEIEFASQDEAEVWVRTNAAARRNLSDDQRAVNAKFLKDALTRVAKRTRAQKGRAVGGKRRPDELTGDRLDTTSVSKRSERSTAKTAKTHQVSERKIREVDALDQEAPDLIPRVLQGKLSIKSAKRVLKQRAKDAQQAKAKVIATTTPLPERCELRVADVRAFLESLSGLDAIITDPPYALDSLPLYQALAETAKTALSDRGVVAVMCGQLLLPQVLPLLAGHLPYRWTLAYLTPGGQAVQAWTAKVNIGWKPILIFGKAADWIGDVVKSDVNDNDKRFHHWGQSESGMARLVELLTQPGDLVCDPFLGGGTTAVVSLALGRRFIGADINPQAIQTTHARLVGA